MKLTTQSVLHDIEEKLQKDNPRDSQLILKYFSQLLSSKNDTFSPNSYDVFITVEFLKYISIHLDFDDQAVPNILSIFGQTMDNETWTSDKLSELIGTDLIDDIFNNPREEVKMMFSLWRRKSIDLPDVLRLTAEIDYVELWTDRLKQIANIVQHLETLEPSSSEARLLLEYTDDILSKLELLRDFSDESTPPEDTVHRPPVKIISSPYTGIPFQDPKDNQAILRVLLEKIGQPSVVEDLKAVLNHVDLYFDRSDKPMVILLFTGLPFSGKCLAAQALAKAIYGSEDKVFSIKMGQFGQRDSINKLIGISPEYPKYRGPLTNVLLTEPQSVLLFDRIEMADPSVLDALLRFFDTGIIENKTIRIEGVKHCVVVLDTNFTIPNGLGELFGEVEAFKKPSLLTWQARQKDLKANNAYSNFFRPEFIKVVDDIISFQLLGRNNYATIIRNMLKDITAMFSLENNCKIHYDELLIKKLVELCSQRANEGIDVAFSVIVDSLMKPNRHFFESIGNMAGRPVEIVWQNEQVLAKFPD